ncbi:MAG TPA: DUF5103 domain-containing protein [Paludibacteraceae bacterium]|nr:DUF5103 domain-containing protein [Paludibacteraceae bacterium]
MKRIAVLYLSLAIYAFAQAQFRTQLFVDNVKTLQVIFPDDPLALPIMDLDSENRLCVSFDELSFDIKNYHYKIVHCNADWTPSNLQESEFLEGFANGQITDYALSRNTTKLYTNYRFFVPNDDLKLKISGNYAVLIAEDNDFDNLIGTACFSVVEPLLSVNAKVRGNTDIELNGRFQQLEITIDRTGYEVRDPFSEIKVLVRQNNRFDTQAANLKPTFISGNTLTFINNRALIFEGGNQYRGIDFASEYAYGGGIERIVFERGAFQVILSEDSERKGRGVAQGHDANGKFIVNRQSSEDKNTEADYMWVHFSFKRPEPFLNGSVHLLGDLCYNRLDNSSRMHYNFETHCYEKSLLLKQGGYNFQYIFVPSGTSKGTLEQTEGSYWQTDNEYAIYVYHRPWGERYDRLVVVKTIRN